MAAKTIAVFIVGGLLSALLAACAQTAQPEKEQDSIAGMRTLIQTRAGELTLSYAFGKATLQGILQRSTPCVNWRIDAVVMESYPEQVRFSIEDISTAEVCIQMLGEPQEVSASVEVSEDALYTILFQEETVFEGQLG